MTVLLLKKAEQPAKEDESGVQEDELKDHVSLFEDEFV